MNLLHLVPYDVFQTKMARERFRQVASLPTTFCGVSVHTTGPGWPDWPDGTAPADWVMQYCLARQATKPAYPDLVLSYQVGGLQGIPVPVCVILQEAYDRPKTLRLIREETNARLVIFTYANELPQYQAELEADGRYVTSIPHSGDDVLFRDYGLEKTLDVLIVGNMNSTIYPFRCRLARLALRELRKRGYRVQQLPHPGYRLPPKPGEARVGEAYARLVSQARLVITCTSRYKYALSKLVEIPLAGALPVSDLPAERQGFFRQTMLNVEPWMLDREIQQALEDLLDDPEALARVTKIAQEKVAFRLGMRYWAERFVYWVRRFLGEDPHPPMPPVGDEDL